MIRPVVSLTPSRRNLQKARRFGVRGESLFFIFRCPYRNVETPEQRVAAVEQQELQQEQDEGRSDQVLELFVELLEAEGRQVAFLHIVDRTYDFVQPDRLVGRADVAPSVACAIFSSRGSPSFDTTISPLSSLMNSPPIWIGAPSGVPMPNGETCWTCPCSGRPVPALQWPAGVVPFAVGDEHDDASCGVISFSEKDMVASERA